MCNGTAGGRAGKFFQRDVRIWESSERMEGILQELVYQTKASLDTMELFMWGECFLRTQEMGKLEESEEAESVLGRHYRRWTGSREKETEPVQEPEVAMGVAPESVPETDVDMTLQ